MCLYDRLRLIPINEMLQFDPMKHLQKLTRPASSLSFSIAPVVGVTTIARTCMIGRHDHGAAREVLVTADNGVV